MKTNLKIKTGLMLGLLLIVSQSCSQTNKKSENMITKEQYNSISKEVKTYEYNPSYYALVNNKNCTYEIYINDVLVDYSFSVGNAAGEQPIPISGYILKSGIQSIRYKIYPKAITNGVLNKLLDNTAYFTTRVTIGDALHLSVKEEDNKEILSLKLPVQDKINVPYYEYTTTFEAKVPYELKGWTAGVDLSKEDPKKLEEEVLQVYDKFKTAFENKDVPTIATMIYNREKEIAQAYYMVSGKEPNYDKGWEELEEKTDALIKMYPIENYEIRIIGHGKLVEIVVKEGKFKNFPVVSGSTGKKRRFYGLILHRPSFNAPLEVIR